MHDLKKKIFCFGLINKNRGRGWTDLPNQNLENYEEKYKDLGKNTKKNTKIWGKIQRFSGSFLNSLYRPKKIIKCYHSDMPNKNTKKIQRFWRSIQRFFK